MTWEDDAKVQAETAAMRKGKRLAARKQAREEYDALVEVAMGTAMAKAITTLTKFKDLFGNRFVATRSFKGAPEAVKEFGIKDKDDMSFRIDVTRVEKDRIEIHVDGVKYECDFWYHPDLRRLTLDPKPTRYPDTARVLHPNHAEELYTGRAFESGVYLGAVAVEWAKKHKYSYRD